MQPDIDYEKHNFFLLTLDKYYTIALYKYQILYKAFLLTNFTSHSFAVEKGRYDKYINTQTHTTFAIIVITC